MLFKVVLQALGYDGFHHSLDFRVAQLCLGLSLELGVEQLDADHRRQPFPNVFSGQVGMVVPQELLLAGVVVQGAGYRGTESGEVGAPVRRVDAVGECVDQLRIARVVLQRHLYHGVFHRLLYVDGLLGKHVAVVVEVELYKVGDTALKVVGLLCFFRSARQVPGAEEVYVKALVQVGHLAESLGQLVIVVFNAAEDLGVRQERYDCSVLVAVSHRFHIAQRLPPAELLHRQVSVAVYLHPHPL